MEYIEPQSIPNTEDTQPQTSDKENDITREGNLLGFVLPGSSSVGLHCCAKRKTIHQDRKRHIVRSNLNKDE